MFVRVTKLSNIFLSHYFVVTHKDLSRWTQREEKEEKKEYEEDKEDEEKWVERNTTPPQRVHPSPCITTH